MMKHLRSNTDQARVYIYTADDERLLTIDCSLDSCTTTSGTVENWTLRDLSGQVIRTYRHPWDGGWQWTSDYIHRQGQPLAAIYLDEGAQVVDHLHLDHLDHLGTPRQITRDGTQVARHTYYPFGQEATDPDQSAVNLKFTDHERDQNGNGSRGVLDYMHARHCSPELGRFTSVDPVTLSPAGSQAWNRYSYVLNNPLNLNDPEGTSPVLAFEGIVLDLYYFCHLGGSCVEVVRTAGTVSAPSTTGIQGLLDLIGSRLQSDTLRSVQAKLQGLLENLLGRGSENVLPSNITFIDGRFEQSGLSTEEIAQLTVAGFGIAIAVNQVDNQIRKGQAPKDARRADRGKVTGEQDHIHFKGGHALNRDGSWKEGGRPLTNREKTWLRKIGWELPTSP